MKRFAHPVMMITLAIQFCIAVWKVVLRGLTAARKQQVTVKHCVPAADRRARFSRTLYTRVTNPQSTISLNSTVPLTVGLIEGDYETGSIRPDYLHRALLYSCQNSWFILWRFWVRILVGCAVVRQTAIFFLISWGVVRGVKRLAESRTTGIAFPAVTSMLVLWLKTYSWSSSVVNWSHHLMLMVGMRVNHICYVAWCFLLHQHIFVL